MICPDCSKSKSVVIETRRTKTYSRRRRECLFCGHRWTTTEIPVERLNELLKFEKSFTEICNSMEHFYD